LRKKRGYSKHKTNIFYNKKNSDLKINIPRKSEITFSFFYFFEEKKRGGFWPGHLPKQVTQLDTKGRQLSFLNGELLFK